MAWTNGQDPRTIEWATVTLGLLHVETAKYLALRRWLKEHAGILTDLARERP